MTIPGSVLSIGDNVFDSCASLTSIIFLGNSPIGSEGAFGFGLPVTIYYYYGTSGWDIGFGGYPTVMLGAPAPQIGGGGSIGVQSNEFNFTITGVTNQPVVIEASTNLVNWQPGWTNTLFAASINFADPQWTNYPNRFYRARSN